MAKVESSKKEYVYQVVITYTDFSREDPEAGAYDLEDADSDEAKEVFKSEEEAKAALSKYYQEAHQEYIDDYYEEDDDEGLCKLQSRLDKISDQINNCKKVMEEAGPAVKEILQKEIAALQPKADKARKEISKYRAKHKKAAPIGAGPNDYRSEDGFCVSLVYDEGWCIHAISGRIEKHLLH